MSAGAILLLAVGLAMDATAVSAARGASAPRLRWRDVLLVAGAFGGAQALMPALGWGLLAQLGPWVDVWARWLAFSMLALIGCRMLYRGFVPSEEAPVVDGAFTAIEILTLAVATSLDAFAAGATLRLVGAPFVASLLTIGLVTMAFSAAGLAIGRYLGAAVGERFEALGGVVLIGVSLHILRG